MQAWMIALAIGLYFFLLLFIGWFTSRKANSETYFIGNHKSIWWLVAIGMLSDSMSGVSFISVPGDVRNSGFTYMQVVMGYVLGYIVIAFMLLPLYYKLKLTSIYSYLGGRFGDREQKTGAGFFVLSRLIGAAGRLYLTAMILQTYLFDAMGVPFWLSVSIIIVLILAYTIKGGIRTLVFTDAMQSAFLVGGLILCVYSLIQGLPEGTRSGALTGMFHDVQLHDSYIVFKSWFNFNPMEDSYFWKHFIGGAFICIAMTGLDQNMMQKNLSCKSLWDAQKNILSTGAVVFLVNIIFLTLGMLMYVYVVANGIELPMKNGKVLTDGVFPMLALNHLGWGAGLAFILGLAAATFSSADSVLTTLTTSTYIDFLGLDKNKRLSEKQKLQRRNVLHIGFAVLLLIVILIFREFNDDTLIRTLLRIAGYTYGPLLGLFAFGLFSKRNLSTPLTVVVCLLAPAITFGCTMIPAENIGGYKFGFEIYIINGLLTFLGLWMVSKKSVKRQT